ncbi:MAG: ACR3 family arsenite efflux transporter [Firmicutes bacterium]|nr:ACR3 family arsenite efflux transporter [Bacillota bacterium]
MNPRGISVFEKYLTVFVLICMILGVMVGTWFPSVVLFIKKFEIESVNMIIAVLIWLMIYPMMLKIDFKSILHVKDNPKGLYLTWIINWVIKPFTMYLIALFFFKVVFSNWIPVDLQNDYLAGAILLGAAPCTAMVFVWSHLTKGNPAYTLIQVATNDLIVLLLYVPIVGLLLGISGITIPYGTLFLSIVLFVVIPLLLSYFTRTILIKRKGIEYLNQKFIPKFKELTIIGLLLTLILIFSLQSDLILSFPLHILLIAVPLILQTFLIFFLGYYLSYKMKLTHDIASPSAMIGASNFFELSVAVAISVFPLSPAVSLATIVGVLVEVPVMLLLVKISNRTKHYFK